MRKPSSIEYYRCTSSFQGLRKTLGTAQFAEDREKSLAYWVVPSDRRFPHAFLGRTLGEVLDTSFDDLAATAGVGHKKMKSLIKLLARVAQRKPAAPDPAKLVGRQQRDNSRCCCPQGKFDPNAISQDMWDDWAKAIRTAGAQHEKIGRVATSLQSLPTAIWTTPLDWYLNQSLIDIRRLRTYGEKRVRSVLEAMHDVYEIVASLRPTSHLGARLTPIFVAAIEQWIQQSMTEPQQVTRQAVRESLLTPLVRQVTIDCGTVVARVVESRLSIRLGAASVRAISQRLEVSRARIYQLLDESERAMNLRWPDGRCQLTHLVERLADLQPEPDGVVVIRTAINVFFPDATEVARRAEES
ncbi:MAG: hypothetical protein IT427_16695 [Pirellulales bacterium]|nr:hypothetical protein [Pirellulales bacterium]